MKFSQNMGLIECLLIIPNQKKIFINPFDVESVIPWSEDNGLTIHSELIMRTGHKHIVKGLPKTVNNRLNQVKGVDYINPPSQPISLRDYFAAAALPGLIKKYGGITEIPSLAYALADSMIRFREGKGEQG